MGDGLRLEVRIGRFVFGMLRVGRFCTRCVSFVVCVVFGGSGELIVVCLFIAAWS